MAANYVPDATMIMIIIILYYAKKAAQKVKKMMMMKIQVIDLLVVCHRSCQLELCVLCF